ncbi:hypothetical protein AVEN_189994-1 [Araneus ventricosus]|uniref:Uncharacterized protein n=1 Tax=Araneus ventricosus TaxID=182803 RepID=A0A4Y2R1A7_ARAVE|nr:hypothetical protein AVEN_189994-1 [Araneus ventricosus]
MHCQKLSELSGWMKLALHLHMSQKLIDFQGETETSMQYADQNYQAFSETEQHCIAQARNYRLSGSIAITRRPKLSFRGGQELACMGRETL